MCASSMRDAIWARWFAASGWRSSSPPVCSVAHACWRACACRATGALFVSEALDQALLEFANSLRGHGAEHDLGADALRWRYAQHPHTRFAFGKYYSSGEIRGFVVLEDDELNRVCSIYDLAAKTAVDAQRMLALLLSRGLSSELNSVRMVVNDRHPLKGCLRGLGFIPRPADSVFQVHSLSGAAERFAWCVTHGAKDT